MYAYLHIEISKRLKQGQWWGVVYWSIEILNFSESFGYWSRKKFSGAIQNQRLTNLCLVTYKPVQSIGTGLLEQGCLWLL